MTALLLLMGIAQACPDLTGAYLCKASAHHPDTVYAFQQIPVGENFKYTMTAKAVGQNFSTQYEFLTDGIEREISEATSGIKLLLRAECSEQTLKVRGTAALDKPEKIYFSEDLSLDAQNNLVNQSITIDGTPVTETCIRHH
jgi:hypothetical protein